MGMNPNAMKFSMGQNQNPLMAFGGGTAAPKSSFTGAFGSSQSGNQWMDVLSMIMPMLSGKGQEEAQPQTNNMNQYQSPQFMPGQFDTQKTPYSASVMKALMGGL